jgi:hypothetical protein
MLDARALRRLSTEGGGQNLRRPRTVVYLAERLLQAAQRREPGAKARAITGTKQFERVTQALGRQTQGVPLG